MPKTKKKKIDVKSLLRKGVPAILIPGFLAAAVLGWKTGALDKVQNYYQIKALFPENGVVTEITDGDTFVLKNGVSVRMLGINSPEGNSSASAYLEKNLLGKKVFLEYDRYQDDKYGRVLAWVWTGCENSPTFLPADYMHKSNNESNVGLIENPEGCKKGKLVNEDLVILHYASPVVYKDRGELKYENRINAP